jgi:magnesium transporter
MIRTLYRAPDGQVRADLQPEDLTMALRESEGFLWLDIADEPPDTSEPILRETFGFHPLAVEDAIEQSHVPKADDWGDYVYLVLHAVLIEDDAVRTNYLVTYQTQPIAALERVLEDCSRDKDYLSKGPARVLCRVADEVVDDYMVEVDDIDQAIDEIESQLFIASRPYLPERIFTLKRELFGLRRIIAPQREVLNKLARGDYAVISENDRVYFRDVYDHLVRLHDVAESLRDRVAGALETYLSVINNRMNDVMKTLTIVTTFFMPLSFIVGFFGMNFFQAAQPMGAWTGKMMFVLILAAMISTPIAMYLWMRHKAWL